MTLIKARLRLPDGSDLAYSIRESSRGKGLRLRINARDGLLVTVPPRTSLARVEALVAARRDWVARHISRFDEVRHLFGEPDLERPESVVLSAVNEHWRVAYRRSAARTVSVKSVAPDQLKVYGAIDDLHATHAALRRWLARHARHVLEPWLERVAAEMATPFQSLSIKNQRARWGSCSNRGSINLNCKLLFLTEDMVRYVLVHELCHIHEANHSPRFWALVERHEPRVAEIHASIREAWRLIPNWAYALPGGGR